MGGGASRVQTLEDQEELQARLARASNDRHHLVLMNLNTGKLASHSTNIAKINAKLIKATDKLVEQKAKYTKQVDVKTKAVKSKQKEIEELKHAERLVAECMSTLEPLKIQLAELVVEYETGLREMQEKRENKAAGSAASAGAAGQTNNQNTAADSSASQPRVGGLTGDGDSAAGGGGGGARSAGSASPAVSNAGSRFADDIIDEDISDLGGDDHHKDLTIHIHTGRGGGGGGQELPLAAAVATV